MAYEGNNAIPLVAALMLITTSVVTGCSSTSPTSTSTSTQGPTSTGSPSAQAPTTTPGQSTTPEQPTSSTAPVTDGKRGLEPCQTLHLSLAQGRVDGTAGSSYVTYYLSNRGPDTCLMVGYPGFSFLFANGSVIQHPATRNGAAYKLVRVQPGKRVQFVVRTVDGSIPGTGCSTSWKTAKVQVYPPNQTTPIRQPSTIAACDLTVGPVSLA